jgi:hypothetical protein
MISYYIIPTLVATQEALPEKQGGGHSESQKRFKKNLYLHNGAIFLLKISI